jgi:hypothetical protein
MDNFAGISKVEKSAPLQQNEATPVLPYEVPVRTAFAIERDDAHLLIRIPRLSSWRQLHRAHLLALVPIVVVALLVYEVVSKATPITEIAPPILIYLVITLLIVLHAVYRLTTRTVIEVSRNSLTITLINIGARTMRWGRDTVHEIRLNPNNGKLLVRAAGRDMAEFFLSPDRNLNQRIVDTTQDAVFRDKFEFSDFSDDGKNRPKTHPSPLPIVLLLAALIIGIGGYVLASVSAPHSVGMLIIIVGGLLAMIAVGITFGIQERKFFT